MDKPRFIVTRSLEQLSTLERDSGRAGGPDSSIVPWAMAELIRWSGAVPGMPTLRATAHGERLVDGVHLIAAVVEAGVHEQIGCILLCGPNDAAPVGARPFSAAAAAETGTDARTVSFERPLEAIEQDDFVTGFTVGPQRVSDRTYGWAESVVGTGKLGDWLSWCRMVEEQARRLPTIVAINGRRPAWAATP